MAFGFLLLEHFGHEVSQLIDLLDAVVDTVPVPQVMDRPDFSMVVTMIEGDTFVGRICTGRIASGSAKVGDSVVALDNAGNKVDSGRITKIMARKGGARMELSGATAGDIGLDVEGSSSSLVALQGVLGVFKIMPNSPFIDFSVKK